LFGFLKNRKRRAIRTADYAPTVAAAVESNVAIARTISSAPLRSKLDEIIKILIAELNWEGCDGLSVSDEMRATISGQAAIMLIGIKDYFFETVPSILVFPQSFSRDQHGRQSWRSGEAWQFGPIALSWGDVLRDSKRLNGHNVVIHEFAHHLDGLDGEMGGSIPFADRSKLQRWHEVSEREFQSLESAARENRPTLLDHYGASNMAEFFAVASECFFELPSEMQNEHTELFGLLCDFYQINPTKW
jgi:Mlc titration factor MtfA (ptsG expression regulator)